MSGQKPSNVDQKDWNALQQNLQSVSAGGISASELATADPNKLGNDPKMEMVWAEKAFKHAETYLKLLDVIKDKKKLRLSGADDDIYKEFRKVFPKLNIAILSDSFKSSPANIKKWRPLLMKYEKNSKVKDYNMGTLLRKDVSKGIDADNTIIVSRICFLCIEIARNREGLNK